MSAVTLAEMPAPTADEPAAWAEALAATRDAGVPVVCLDFRTEKARSYRIVEGAQKVILTLLATPEGLAILPGNKSANVALYCKSGHR